MGRDLFDGYAPDGFFDEMFEPDGGVREHYRAVHDRLQGLSARELGRRERLVTPPSAASVRGT